MALYRQRARMVDAQQVWEPTEVQLPGGRTECVQPGDYIVTTRTGEQFVYRAETFEANFEQPHSCESLHAPAEPALQTKLDAKRLAQAS